MRSTLMPKAPIVSESSEHGDCSCAICNPMIRHAAGQPSHEFHHNKVPRCNKNGNPTRPHWETDVSQTFKSDFVTEAVEHPDEAGKVPKQEELAFTQNMGRKVKGPVPISPGSGRTFLHRSWSADSIRVAGDYDLEGYAVMPDARYRGRQAWQGSQGSQPSRSGVAIVVAPRDGDPAAPSGIVALRKGEGQFNHRVTEDSKRHAVRSNQENFRFANVENKKPRPKSSTRCKPDGAGRASGAACDHMNGCGNPLTMEGKKGVKGGSLNSMWSASQPSLRYNPGRDSSGFAYLINHNAVEKGFASEAATRRRVDKPFAELCGYTADLKQQTQSARDTIRDRTGHRTTQVQHLMSWTE